jgi:hypothetical protein
MGIMPGDHVAVVGSGNRCGWARLARVQITAEMPHFGGGFRTANDRLKSEALQALFGSGVKAVVADHREQAECPIGWKAAGETGSYVCAPPSDFRPKSRLASTIRLPPSELEVEERCILPSYNSQDTCSECAEQHATHRQTPPMCHLKRVLTKMGKH